MRIKTDICEKIDVPDELLKAFEKEMGIVVKDGKTLEDDDLFWDFSEFCRNYVDISPDGCQSELVDEDVAVFIARMTTCFVSDGGGYPVEGYHEFKIGGKEYGVVAFSWTSDLDDKSLIEMIAYRKKQKERKARKKSRQK